MTILHALCSLLVVVVTCCAELDFLKVSQASTWHTARDENCPLVQLTLAWSLLAHRCGLDYELFPFCLCSGDGFSDVLARMGSYCRSGGPRCCAEMALREHFSLFFEGSTWRTARDWTFSDGSAPTCSIGTCVQFRVFWTSYNFLTVSMDGRASSGDGFSVVLQRFFHLSFQGSEVQGLEPTNCSARRWQLLDKAFLS